MDNIYIKALEIGTKNLDNGISYNQISTSLGINSKSRMFKDSFQVWFYKNFFHPSAQDIEIERLKGSNLSYPESIHTQNSILTGKAYMDYLDYIELKEARQSSKTAKLIAITSIIITGLIALAQILISICN